MFLLIEIAMFMGGLVALIGSKFQLMRNISLEGWRARVIGTILITPLLLGLVCRAIIWEMIARGRLPLHSSSFVIDGFLILGGITCAVLFGLIFKSKVNDAPLIKDSAINEDPK